MAASKEEAAKPVLVCPLMSLNGIAFDSRRR